MRIKNFQEEVTGTEETLNTIHIHPTTLCNLTCRHCYSNSSPYAKSKGLDPEVLKPFLKYAYAEGFKELSISGGEPFVYDGLEELVNTAVDMGYKISVVTNGTMLKTSKAKKILPFVDKLSISVDGVPLVHNEIRNDPRAFDKVLNAIEVANKYSENYGIIHTLSARSWDSLLWFGEFAYDNGADFLQIHPLELTGRAAIDMLMLELDQITLHKVYFLTNYMQNKYGEDLKIKLDLVHKNYIERNPSLVNAYPHIKNYSDEPMARILKSIVIDETGDIVPLSYGFSRQFLIGNVHYDAEKDVFGSFLQKHGKELKNFFMMAYWKMVNDKENDLYNLEEFLMSESLRVEVSENVA